MDTYVDKSLAFFDHLPHYVDIFYLTYVDKKVNIFELPTHLLLSTYLKNAPLSEGSVEISC